MSSTDTRADRVIPSRLILVRHAQASFGSADYDELSERGRQQAEHLGAWFASHDDLRFAGVSCGTLRRQQQTLDAIARAFAARGLPLPDIVQDSDWNEFDHDAVIGAYAGMHADDPQLAAAQSGRDRRAIHALLAAALRAWARGELDTIVPETWTAFGVRATRAQAKIEQMASGGRILVVSSGGVIARCAQAALGCDAARTVDLNLSLRNTAISEFRSEGEGLRLLTWNALPHYAAPSMREWVTYY